MLIDDLFNNESLLFNGYSIFISKSQKGKQLLFRVYTNDGDDSKSSNFEIFAKNLLIQFLSITLLNSGLYLSGLFIDKGAVVKNNIATQFIYSNRVELNILSGKEVKLSNELISNLNIEYQYNDKQIQYMREVLESLQLEDKVLCYLFLYEILFTMTNETHQQKKQEHVDIFITENFSNISVYNNDTNNKYCFKVRHNYGVTHITLLRNIISHSNCLKTSNIILFQNDIKDNIDILLKIILCYLRSTFI